MSNAKTKDKILIYLHWREWMLNINSWILCVCVCVRSLHSFTSIWHYFQAIRAWIWRRPQSKRESRTSFSHFNILFLCVFVSIQFAHLFWLFILRSFMCARSGPSDHSLCLCGFRFSFSYFLQFYLLITVLGWMARQPKTIQFRETYEFNLNKLRACVAYIHIRMWYLICSKIVASMMI